MVLQHMHQVVDHCPRLRPRRKDPYLYPMVTCQTGMGQISGAATPSPPLVTHPNDQKGGNNGGYNNGTVGSNNSGGSGGEISPTLLCPGGGAPQGKGGGNSNSQEGKPLGNSQPVQYLYLRIRILAGKNTRGGTSEYGATHCERMYLLQKVASGHELLRRVYLRKFPLPSLGAAIETVATALVAERAVVPIDK